MSKQVKRITPKPLLSQRMSIILMLVLVVLIAAYFVPQVATLKSQGSSIYVRISSDRPFAGVLVAMQTAPFTPDAFAEGIPIPHLIAPFSCLFEDWTNDTAFCMTTFSLTTSTTIHLHGIKQGYYFLRMSAYVPGGISTVDKLVNITGSGTYHVTATYTRNGVNVTSLTPGMEVTTP